MQSKPSWVYQVSIFQMHPNKWSEKYFSGTLFYLFYHFIYSKSISFLWWNNNNALNKLSYQLPTNLLGRGAQRKQLLYVDYNELNCCIRWQRAHKNAQQNCQVDKCYANWKWAVSYELWTRSGSTHSSGNNRITEQQATDSIRNDLHLKTIRENSKHRSYSYSYAVSDNSFHIKRKITIQKQMFLSFIQQIEFYVYCFHFWIDLHVCW